MLNSNPAATDDDIWKALETANADKFVNALPDKLDTDVGAVGGRLSGGQKQRIAIARALIRNPDLLIFDEATSALDLESERKVTHAIENTDKLGITKVIIAHRLDTIKTADKIIVMSQGEISESGTHDELLKNESAYFDLYNLQQSAQVAAIVHHNDEVEHMHNEYEELTDDDGEQRGMNSSPESS